MKRWLLVVGVVCFAPFCVGQSVLTASTLDLTLSVASVKQEVLATAESGVTVNTSVGPFCSPRSRQ